MTNATTRGSTRTPQRRSPREGSVYQRKGRPGWRGELVWDGHRHIVSGATAEEARDRLTEVRSRLQRGARERPGTGTVGDYLTSWIERRKGRVRPSTYALQEAHVRTYLIPSLGKIKLTRLSRIDVEAAMAEWQRAGRPIQGGDRRKRRPVSPVTVLHVRAVLRAALGEAVEDGLILRNAAREAHPPRVPHREVTYLTAAQLGQLLTAAVDDPFEPLWRLAVATGMRRGELLALRWADVDLAAGTLRVARSMARDGDGGWAPAETKSARSRRTLPLAAMARQALERQRRRQAEWRLAAGTGWGGGETVFTDESGRPLLPERVSHAWEGARRRAGLPDARLHDLRHTTGTMLVAAGTPLTTVSEILGHADMATTARFYVGSVPEHHRRAADALDEAMGGGA